MFSEGGLLGSLSNQKRSVKFHVSHKASSSIMFLLASPNEVRGILVSLCSYSASSADIREAKSVEFVSEFISCPLPHICNYIVFSGVCSNNMKLDLLSLIPKYCPLWMFIETGPSPFSRKSPKWQKKLSTRLC